MKPSATDVRIMGRRVAERFAAITSPEPQDPSAGDVCLARKGQNPRMRGVFTGGQRRCQLESCSGVRYGVRWPKGRMVDGKLAKQGTMTWPCSKGVRWLGKGQWEIA